MRKTMLLPFILVTSFAHLASGQTQTEFPLGVFLYENGSVDYQQMKDTLGVTWVQGWGGWENHPAGAETNSHGLKAMSIRNNIYTYSKSQRMIYQAENRTPEPEEEWLWNYFAYEHRTGGASGPEWRCLAGIDPVGFMAKDPWPNNEFHYKQSTYFATFALKVDKSSNPDPDAQVVQLKILCTTDGHSHAALLDVQLLNSDFVSSGVFQDFSYSFPMQVQSGGSVAAQYLAGRQGVRSSFEYCTSVDVQVYWYGGVTTSLDKVTIEDDTGHDLFTGSYNNSIDADMTGLTPLVERMYLTDEPFLSAFLSYDYVNDRIKATRPGITATFFHDNRVQRFVEDGQPNEVLSDIYTIDADVPSPSMDSTQASAVGVADYTTDAQYADTLQERLDRLSIRLDGVAQNSTAAGRFFWYVPQLHGEYHIGTQQYRKGSVARLRPPTGNEIKSSVNIAIAHGAKGILGYPYGTDMWDDDVDYWAFVGLVSQIPSPDGIKRNHWTNTTTIDGKQIFTGYAEKWDAFRNLCSKVSGLGPTLVALDWQSSIRRHSYGTSLPDAFRLATGVTDVITSVDPIARTFVEIGHFKDGGGIDYLYVVNRRTLSSESRSVKVKFSGNRFVTNLSTNKKWLVAANGSFVDQIGPGDGMLYKVETLNLSPYVHVPSGQTYYIDRGNIFSFSSGGSLYVQGKLTAIGSSSQPIVFTSSSTWIGVNFDGSGASNSELRYCTINNCSGYGIQVKGNTGVTLSHLNINGISNSAAGVFFAQGAGGTLENSGIYKCGNGQGVFVTGGSNPTLQYNEIEDNYFDGILISGNGTATPRLEGNFLSDNGVVGGTKTYYGVYVLNSRAEIVQNTIEGSLYGLAGSDYASINPSAYGEDGCNAVSSNTYGLLAYNYSGMNLGVTDKPNYFNQNSILGNTTYQAVAGNSSSITALANWWGSSSPPASWFYAYGSSTINYQPWLTSSPSCGGQYAPEGPVLLSQEAVSAQVEQLVGVLEGDSTIVERQKALVGLYDLFRETRDMSLITEIGRFAAPESDLSTLATELLMYAHTWTGEYEKAAKAAGTLRESSSGGDVEMRTLAHMAHLVGFSASQRSVSKQAYDELVRKYGDTLNQSLLSALKELNDLSPPSSFQATLGSAIAESQELEVQDQGREFALGQNYPNPFNPTTTINYVLPGRLHVSLIVYNALGQVVSILVDDYQEEGYHEVRFSGKGLSSGIYLYTLQAGEFVQTRTMLLLR